MFYKSKISSIVIAVVLILLLWYWFYGRKESYDWNIGLRTDSYEPYDLGILYESLKEEKKEQFIAISNRSSLKESRSELLSHKDGTYLFVGNRWFVDEAEAGLLRQFMTDGGTVFLSIPGISEQFANALPLLKEIYPVTFYEDSISIGFRHKSFGNKQYGFNFLRKNKKKNQAWFAFDFGYHTEMNPLSDKMVFVSNISNTNYVDCVRISVGKGFLYLHCNPLLFTNLYVTTKAGQNYVSNILQHLPNGPVIYDHSGIVPKPGATVISAKQSILSFIQSNKALRAAWVLLISGLLLFVFIGGRRRKRPVNPLIVPENNSMKLVETMGYLYAEGRRNNQLVFKRELNYFYDYCKSNFRILPSSTDSFQELSDKSGVSHELTETIRKKIDKYRIFSELSNEELLDFSSNINQFYTEHRKQYGR